MRPETANWLELAQIDYADSLYLFKAARHPNAVYLLCQAVEKVLKAAQTAVAGTTPRKTHHLVTLAQESGLSFSTAQRDELAELSRHYRRIRYRDLAQTRYNTKAKVTSIMQSGQRLYIWIHTQLTTT